MKTRVRNDKYEVFDDETSLTDLTFSITRLRPGQSTEGNRSDVDEVYVFLGSAQVTVNDEARFVQSGDHLLVGKTVFRQVINRSTETLVFYNVWKNS